MQDWNVRTRLPIQRVPGLVGALMVGSGMANGLGLAWDCPVIPVHHMEGHLLAPMLEDKCAGLPVPGPAGLGWTHDADCGARAR